MVVQCSRHDEVVSVNEEKQLKASEVAHRVVQAAGVEEVQVQ